MIRITSGILKGRRFEVVGAGVRPTMESVREAIFSSLGGDQCGRRVLDLFAGSGSLGLEAWSRGASEVVFVEADTRVAKQLQERVSTFASEALGTAHVQCADALRWLEQSHPAYDLILADPPYDMPEAFEQTLRGVAKSALLRENGVLVYEVRAAHKVAAPSAWKVLREKRYGKTRVLTLQQEKR